MTLAERCDRIMTLIDDALAVTALPSPQVDDDAATSAATRETAP